MERITDTAPDIRVAFRTIGLQVINDTLYDGSLPIAFITGNQVKCTSDIHRDDISEVITKLNKVGGNYQLV